MPKAVHRMYDRLSARVADPEVAALIAAERQVVEFACYRAELPAIVVQLAERLTDRQLDLIVPLFVEFRDLNSSMATLPEAELHRRVDAMAEHAVDFVATLGFSPDEIRSLLEQASLSSGEYVGYATTELFAKPLQERFQIGLVTELLRQGLLPAEPKGADS